jgi:acyl-CoA thioesterase-1
MGPSLIVASLVSFIHRLALARGRVSSCRAITLRRYGLAALVVKIVAGLLASSVAGAEPLRLVVLGDSLTAGYGLPIKDAFPAQLEAALRARGIGVTVVNAGVSGDTTAGGRARLDWVLASTPSAVIIELGANDGLRGIEPAATAGNLDAIIVQLRQRRIPILLAGMYAPANLGRDYTKAFNAIYPRLAKSHNVILYPFFLDGVAGMPALNQDDGIHPNAKGVATIVERIIPFAIRLLGKAS